MDTFTQQLSQSYTNLTEKLADWLNLIILQVPNMLLAVVVAVIAYFVSGYIRKLAERAGQRFTDNRTVLQLASNLASVVFVVLTLFVILSILNLGETINKFLAAAGVVGLAVGLALQDPMNNLFSGVFMSVRELYNIGDLVETNGYFGTISNIDLRATKLLLPTGQEVVIPNKDVIQNPLTNYTITGQRRVDVSCGVSYGDDLQKVERVVVSALEALDQHIKDQPIDILYDEFGGSSINFKARLWMKTDDHRDYLVLRSEIIKALKIAFDQNDISIPYPIRTLDFGIKGGVPLEDMIDYSGISDN